MKFGPLLLQQFLHSLGPAFAVLHNSSLFPTLVSQEGAIAYYSLNARYGKCVTQCTLRMELALCQADSCVKKKLTSNFFLSVCKDMCG